MGQPVAENKEQIPGSLKWEPIVLSSPECWFYNWQGGFLTKKTFRKATTLTCASRCALWWKEIFRCSKAARLRTIFQRTRAGFLLIGSSKLFENEQIDTMKYQHEKFILKRRGGNLPTKRTRPDTGKRRGSYQRNFLR